MDDQVCVLVPKEVVLTHHGKRLSPELRAKVEAYMLAMWAIAEAETQKPPKRL